MTGEGKIADEGKIIFNLNTVTEIWSVPTICN